MSTGRPSSWRILCGFLFDTTIISSRTVHSVPLLFQSRLLYNAFSCTRITISSALFPCVPSTFFSPSFPRPRSCVSNSFVLSRPDYYRFTQIIIWRSLRTPPLSLAPTHISITLCTIFIQGQSLPPFLQLIFPTSHVQ